MTRRERREKIAERAVVRQRREQFRTRVSPPFFDEADAADWLVKVVKKPVMEALSFVTEWRQWAREQGVSDNTPIQFCY